MPMNLKNIYTCPKCEHPVGWRRKLFTGILGQCNGPVRIAVRPWNLASMDA